MLKWMMLMMMIGKNKQIIKRFFKMEGKTKVAKNSIIGQLGFLEISFDREMWFFLQRKVL